MSTREGGYRNEPMGRDWALNLVLDAGCILSDRFGEKHLAPGTARLELRKAEVGYDVLMPVEQLARLYCRGFDDGVRGKRR